MVSHEEAIALNSDKGLDDDDEEDEKRDDVHNKGDQTQVNEELTQQPQFQPL